MFADPYKFFMFIIIPLVVGFILFESAQVRPLTVGVILRVVVAIGACLVLTAIAGIWSEDYFESYERLRTGGIILAVGIPGWWPLIAARQQRNRHTNPATPTEWRAAIISYVVMCWMCLAITGVVLKFGHILDWQLR